MQPAHRDESEPVADWESQLQSLEAVFGWPNLTTTDVLVFIQLVLWLWRDGRSLPGLVVASAVMVSEAVGAANSRTGRRCLDKLVNAGLITAKEHLGKGRTLYLVNSPAHLRGPRVIRRDDQRLLPGLESAMDTGVDTDVQEGADMDTGVDTDVHAGHDAAGPAREPGRETPNNGTKERESFLLHQSSNEQLGTIGSPPDHAADDPPPAAETFPELLRTRAGAISAYDSATTPKAQRDRILADLKSAAPDLDDWFASYVAGQVLCGRVQERDLRNVFEEMRRKEEAAQQGVTRPIGSRAGYLRSLLRKLPGWIEPTRRAKPPERP